MDENKLNKQDVISLSRNTNIENKSTIARKISIYYNNSSISEQEAKLAEDIFRIMIRDTEIKVREVLADHLKYCNNIPQDIVKSIINDKDKDCFNLLFIISLLFLFLDISGTNDVLSAIIKNDGIVNKGNTYAL